MGKIGILASKQLRSILEGILSSTTHCGQRCRDTLVLMSTPLPVPRGSQIGEVMDRDTNHSSSALFTVPFPTFKMLEVQLVWGEAAQQATLLPLLLQEAKGKVPAGRGHLDPAGKGSSSSSSPSKALGLGQSCRKVPAYGVPSPGVLGVLHPWRDTQIPQGISHSWRGFPPSPAIL